jgi:uncharacterized protein (TIGR03083 family)
MSTSRAASPSEIMDVLHRSHERLTTALVGLGDDGVTRPSYDDGWSVATVASHLGSSAEIFGHYLQAGARDEPAPGGELNQPVWARWDDKSPAEQVRDSITANAALLAAVDDLTEEQRAGWRLELFGMELDLSGLLRMRLSEHAVHTWDVTVALDPASTLPEEAAALVADNLARVAGWAGKPSEQQASVEVRTTSPERAYHLDLGPSGVSLSPSLDDTDAASLSLPTEAFVRLVYGRLDPEHTPAQTVADGVDLDLLRSVFPGL